MNPKAEHDIVTCAMCGSGHLSRRTEIEKFPYGIGPDPVILEVAIEVVHCEDCQFEFTGPAAEEARHQTVCRHLGVMTPAEVKEVRKQCGLSREAFALLTRLGKASISRWESGSHIQNRAYDNYLYLIRYEDNRLRLQSKEQEARKKVKSCGKTGDVATKSEFQYQYIVLTPQIHREKAEFQLRPSYQMQEAA